MRLRSALAPVTDWLDGKKTFIADGVDAAYTIFHDWPGLNASTFTHLALNLLIALGRLLATSPGALSKP